MNMTEWIDQQLFGNALAAWSAALGLFTFVWAALHLLRHVLTKRVERLAAGTGSTAWRLAGHVVARTQSWFFLAIALLAATRVLELPGSIDTALTRGIALTLVLQLGFWLSAALGKFLDLRRERQLAEDPSAVAAIDVLGFVARLAVWSVVLLVFLDNAGINITTLIAGLGVGGIAVALAAQTVLGDLFASLSIVLDKPFAVGDFLSIDEYLGNVEHVGLKTTRLRSLSGEQLVFSNTDLLGSRIRNYGRMFERRIVFSLGVTYQTQADELRAIPGMVRSIIEANEHVRFDRAHLKELGDFALLYEVVYHVLSPDYSLYMDIQQTVNLGIIERFAASGIEFAYPTQTLHVAAGARAALPPMR